MLLAGTTSKAQTTLVHYWHFNTAAFAMYTDTIQGISADFSLIDVSKAKILYQKQPGTSSAYATYIDTYTVKPTTDFDTMNWRMGQTDGMSLRVRNPSDSMQLLFYIPSTGYKNLSLKYGTQGSSRTSGMLLQNFDYSTDSGMTWRTTGLNLIQDSAGVISTATGKPAFALVNINFGTDTTVNNNPKLVFRITFSGNNTGTSGNNRFDNITLDGDSISTHHTGAVTSVYAQVKQLSVFPNPANDNINMVFETESTKVFVIKDMSGATIQSGLISGKSSAINISKLAVGNYSILVQDNTSGELSGAIFSKN